MMKIPTAIPARNIPKKIQRVVSMFIFTTFWMNYCNAQPEIVQLRFSAPLPLQTNVEYSIGSPQIYYEFNDDITNLDGVLSDTVCYGALATVSVIWTNIDSSKHYAFYSSPELVLPPPVWPTDCTNCPTPKPSTWGRNSIWIPLTNGQQSLSWTQSFCEGQRFVKIVER